MKINTETSLMIFHMKDIFNFIKNSAAKHYSFYPEIFYIRYFLYKIDREFLKKSDFSLKEFEKIKSEWKNLEENISPYESVIEFLKDDYKKLSENFTFPFSKLEYEEIFKEHRGTFTWKFLSEVTLLSAARIKTFYKDNSLSVGDVPNYLNFLKLFDFYQNSSFTSIYARKKILTQKSRNSFDVIIKKYKDKLENFLGEEVVSSTELLKILDTSNSASLHDFCYANDIEEYCVTKDLIVINNQKPAPKKGFKILYQSGNDNLKKRPTMGGRKFYKKSQLNKFYSHKKDLENESFKSTLSSKCREIQFESLKKEARDILGCEVCSIRELLPIINSQSNIKYKHNSIGCLTNFFKGQADFVYLRNRTLIFFNKEEVLKSIPLLNDNSIRFESKGEIIMEEFLSKKGIDYIRDKSINVYDDSLGINRCLYCDFYIEKYNLVIEVDGAQHANYIKFFHANLEHFNNCVRRDLLKNQYCNNNNIIMIRIPWYWDHVWSGSNLIERFISEVNKIEEISEEFKNKIGSNMLY